MIAFAEERSAPGLAGVLLALIAVGSLFAGIAYGAVDWRVSQVTLLVCTTSVLTLSAVPLAFAGSLPVMAVLAVVAGVAVSPALIAGSTLLESVAPKELCPRRSHGSTASARWASRRVRPPPRPSPSRVWTSCNGAIRRPAGPSARSSCRPMTSLDSRMGTSVGVQTVLAPAGGSWAGARSSGSWVGSVRSVTPPRGGRAGRLRV
ncbi:hypothetical protein STENM223S_01228 [Streptomyces tendae]